MFHPFARQLYKTKAMIRLVKIWHALHFWYEKVALCPWRCHLSFCPMAGRLLQGRPMLSGCVLLHGTQSIEQSVKEYKSLSTSLLSKSRLLYPHTITELSQERLLSVTERSQNSSRALIHLGLLISAPSFCSPKSVGMPNPASASPFRRFPYSQFSNVLTMRT